MGECLGSIFRRHARGLNARGPYWFGGAKMYLGPHRWESLSPLKTCSSCPVYIIDRLSVALSS